MGRPFTFVHSGDVHLDAPFAGISARDDRVRETLVRATYEAFDKIATIAIENRAEFVLFAGDVYNSRDKSVRAQFRFRSVMERLGNAGIQVYLVNGNHDPADGFSAGLKMPDNVRYFACDKVERIAHRDAEGRLLCTLYGQSYRMSSVTENLARGFVRNNADETAIGVLHTNVGGQPDHEPYAPCSPDDLRSARMDYWALGHIHNSLDLAEDPRIRYCGSPQGLNPKETGAHGCWVVKMDRGKVLSETFAETASVLWERADIDVGGVSDIEGLISAIRGECESKRRDANGLPVILRVYLKSRSEIYQHINRGSALDDLVEELRAEQLQDLPWVWIEKVYNHVEPELDIDFLRGAEDFTGDMIRIADEKLVTPSVAKEFLDNALGDLDKTISFDSDAEELIRRARNLGVGRLMVEGD